MKPGATQTPIYRRSRRVGTYPTWTRTGTETRGVLVVALEITRETFPPDAEWLPDTIHHHAVADYLDVSLVGTMKRGRVDEGGGQCVGELTAEGVRPVAAYTTEDLAELAQLWERWHLPGMRAGCAHQPSYAEAVEGATLSGTLDRYQRPDTYAWQRSRGPCPEGYEYGSAWLVELVDPDAVARLVDLMEQDPETVEQAGQYGGPTAARHAVDVARELFAATV